MLKNKIKENEVDKKELFGKTAELEHDLTIFQYGSLWIDGVRYYAKTSDKTEMCKGTKVKVVGEDGICLVVERY